MKPLIFKECPDGFNLSEHPDDKSIVKVCLMISDDRKRIYEAMAEKDGKKVTGAVCDNHHQDFINYSYGRN